MGFPSSSSGSASIASGSFLEPPLTFEPLRRKPVEAVAQPQTSRDFIDFAQLAHPTPPPVPPRSTGARSKRPPPPRPSSLYAKLTPSVHPTDEYSQVNKPADGYSQVNKPTDEYSQVNKSMDEYSQVNKPARKKRPRSSDFDQRPSSSRPPPLPPHLNLESRPLPSVPPHENEMALETPRSRPLHGSGIPIPLPNSPPAPPPPPHASPNPINEHILNSDKISNLYEAHHSPKRGSRYDSFPRHSTLNSPFYQRPLSLKSRLSSLARSLSPSLTQDDEEDELLELFTDENPGQSTAEIAIGKSSGSHQSYQCI